MSSNRFQATIAIAATGLTAGSALAFSDGIVQEANDPSTWAFADFVTSLDAASTGFDYPVDSGFALVDNVLGELDRTDVVSEVYRFNADNTFDDGTNSLDLFEGDLAFVYRVTLVQSSAQTVTSLTEAQVIGVPAFGFGQDVMAGNLLIGQAVVDNGSNLPGSGNFDDAGVFGSSVDFEWPGADVDNLDNSTTAVLILFSRPAAIGEGVLNLFAPPGQPNNLTGIAQADGAPPILIPIIPAPGGVALGAVGLLAVARRRRR